MKDWFSCTWRVRQGDNISTTLIVMSFYSYSESDSESECRHSAIFGTLPKRTGLVHEETAHWV